MDLLELLCRKADLSFLPLNFISERVSEVAMSKHDKILFLRLKCFSGFMASILYCLTSHLEYWIQGAVVVGELSHVQEKVQKFSVQTNWKKKLVNVERVVVHWNQAVGYILASFLVRETFSSLK